MIKPLPTLQDAFCAALDDDLVALHPTDTLPGLGFHPLKTKGEAALRAFKKRPESSSFISLISGYDVAEALWQPLPNGWKNALATLWPGPLTVVWRARRDAPKVLIAANGTIALRAPSWSQEAAWMQKFLQLFALPFPSSSVNFSGEPPAASWDEAKAKLHSSSSVFIPDFLPSAETSSAPVASTIIEILAAKEFSVRREGAMPSKFILAVVEQSV